MTDPSANLAHTDSDIAAQVENLTGMSKARQERASALRAELAQVEGEIRRLESAIAELQGQNVDQHALRSARSRWAQARRRGKPKAEQERLEREYRALFKGKWCASQT